MSEAASTGSIGQPAPAPAAAPAAPSEGGGGGPQPEAVTQHKSSAVDRKAAATAAFEAARARAKGAPAAAKPEPASATPAPATTPAATPVATPTPSQAMDEAQVAKIARAAAQADREAYESKQRARQLEAEVKELREAAEKRKGLTPLQLLEMEGTTLDGVHEKIVKGEWKPKTAEQLAIEKTEGVAMSAKEELAALKAELQAERDQLRAQQERHYLVNEIKGKAEDFPILDAFDWAPDRVRDAYHAEAKRLADSGVQEQPDLTTVMRSVQDGVEADIKKVFAHDGALKRFLLANKDRVAALLGPATPAITTETTPPASLGTQPQSSSSRRNDPAALTRVAAQDAGTRRTGGTQSTPGERKAAATAALLRARSAKQ